MDAKLLRIKELIETKERVDAELEEMLGGATVRKTVKCSKCGQEGHTARTCDKTKMPAATL